MLPTFFRYITEVTSDDKLQPVLNEYTLNRKGVVLVGTIVKDGDILVSKQKSQLRVEKNKGGKVMCVNMINTGDTIVIHILLQQ